MILLYRSCLYFEENVLRSKLKKNTVSRVSLRFHLAAFNVCLTENELTNATIKFVPSQVENFFYDLS